MNVQNRLF